MNEQYRWKYAMLPGGYLVSFCGCQASLVVSTAIYEVGVVKSELDRAVKDIVNGFNTLHEAKEGSISMFAVHTAKPCTLSYL